MKEHKKPRRICCACKKERKIVNVGGPPLCAECYPLARNWGNAVVHHEEFMMSLAGIDPMKIDTGKDDDFSYWLEEVAKYLAEVKMRLKQTEICITNVCTMLRNEKPKDPGVKWVVNGKCINKGEVICNLGYACDGCPYNKDEKKQ